MHGLRAGQRQGTQVPFSNPLGPALSYRTNKCIVAVPASLLSLLCSIDLLLSLSSLCVSQVCKCGKLEPVRAVTRAVRDVLLSVMTIVYWAAAPLAYDELMHIVAVAPLYFFRIGCFRY